MKKFCVLILSLILCLSLCSCLPIWFLLSDFGKKESSHYEEKDAKRLLLDTSYHNGYLGLSLTVPQGWWTYHIDADNFTDTPSKSTDKKSLHFYEENGYKYLDLASFANLQYSSELLHIGFEVDAEWYEDISTLSEYMEIFETDMLENHDAMYTLEESGLMQINGTLFEKRLYLSQSSNNTTHDPFCILTLTAETANGFFLTFWCTYWEENTQAQDTIEQALTQGLIFGQLL